MENYVSKFINENILLQKLSSKQSLEEFLPAFISIDEVGRGCVAGPVLSCTSLWVHKNLLNSFSHKKQEWLPHINDSKKLSEKKRKHCLSLILKEYGFNLANIPHEKKHPVHPNELVTSRLRYHLNADEFNFYKKQIFFKDAKEFECIFFSLGESSAKEVDAFNIWNAVQLAISRALLTLNKITEQESLIFLKPIIKSAILLMDGKHFINIPKEFQDNIQVTVTQADGLFASVGFSSIVAKVFRDSFMETQDNHFPLFGFSGHKGYGTAKHLSIIKQLGICSLHRKSFLKNYCRETLI